MTEFINMKIFQVGGDVFSNLLWIILFFIMMFLYPRMMISQILWRLDQSFILLSRLTSSAKRMVLKKIPNKKKATPALNNFLEFFLITPVNLDPYGIVKKLEHLINIEIKRFKYFVKKIAPELNEEERNNLIMGISGTMSLHQITKILRHYIEFIKKTKNFQLGLLLQMQLPMIERVSKALHKSVEAFVNGWPIGDSVGPLVAANLLSNSRVREIEEDTVIGKRRIYGKNVYIMKAKGPGGRVGKLGRAVEKTVKKYKIEKIITIDASVKLEGEKTGSIAEGIGVAMGGIGVDRSIIEEISTKNKIPLDSIIVKMSNEEAFMPMKKEILNSIKQVTEAILRNIKESEEKRILVVGVGNTIGIGNNAKSAKKAEEKIIRVYKELSKREGYWEEKPKKKFSGFFTGF